jgi:hypothetical protein
MNKKIISAVAATFLMTISTAHAGIDTFLNDAVVETTGARSIKTDTGILLYGGGLQMRARSANITPVSITTPSIRAGCGGIDATLGSLSFLDADQLVALMEGMMANAPGVMFEMALKVICPSCMDTLNALQQLSNQINGINLDSCAATKAAAGWMESSLKGSVLDGTNADYNIAMQNFNTGVRSMAEKVGKTKSELLSGGCNTNDKSCGARFFMENVGTNSFLNYTMTQDIVDPYLNDTNMINVIRYFAGDITKVEASGTGENQKPGKLKFLGTLTGFTTESGMNDGSSGYSDVQTDANTKNILKYLVGDTNVTEVPNVRDATGNLVSMSAASTNLKTLFENRLSSISDKISARSPLTSVEINFLSMFRVPVYLITNRLASMPNGDIVLNRIKPLLAEMLAYEIAYEYLSRATSIATKQKEKMDVDTIDKIPYSCSSDGCHADIIAGLSTMQKGTRDAARVAYALAAQSHEYVTLALGAQTDMMESITQMQQYTLQRSNPKLFESYMFSKTLTK